MSNQVDISANKPILWIGFFVGLLISWGMLSGDEQGRVNILHLVLIYVFLPIASIVISTIGLILRKGINLATIVSLIPLWSIQQKRDFLKRKQASSSKLYFFYQSQLAALSFSFASLLVFFILLLTTDVNFIWRSTVLSAENIYPFLESLAKPWTFWGLAQPTIEMLVSSQDSRVGSMPVIGNLGDWWRFILAAQLCYALLPRFFVVVLCRLVIWRKSNSANGIQLVTERHSAIDVSKPMAHQSIAHDTTADFALNNWCGLEPTLLEEILKGLSHQSISELKAGPLASFSEQLVAERWQEPQLLLVKGWEPPMGELRDFMQNGRGYLMPLDWDTGQFKSLSDNHLAEWRRFTQVLPDWQILQLEN
ncbi:MAG: DUF2868 domain-containing protein [Kangiellaceae bacterium]|nr:DUF2868 domain-containing protein [Kangiellaceae bacterium]